MIADMIVRTLKSIHSDEKFLLFWKGRQVVLINVNEPILPRQRKRPRRYEDGTSEGTFLKVSKTYIGAHILKLSTLLFLVLRNAFTTPDTRCILT